MELHIIIVNDYDYIMIIHTQTILHKPHSISLKPYEFISLAVLSTICDNANISSETITFCSGEKSYKQESKCLYLLLI